MSVFDYFKIFTALLFMVNPIAAFPTFLAATSSMSPKERSRTTNTAAIAVTLVLVTFCLLGEGLLALFGIRVDSFQVAGGIILMTLALSMLGGEPGATKQRADEAEEALDRQSIGVVPLAIPLLSGPGTMSTMIVYANADPSMTHRGILVLISIGIGIAVWLGLRAADPMRRLLGRTGLNVATRVMGIIVAAVAVEFITTGLLGLLPGLGRI